MIEALMYGMIPIANTEKFLNAPPEMTSKKPNSTPLAISSAMASGRTPGVGTWAPIRKIRSIARVNKSLFLSSVTFTAACKVLKNCN